MCIRDRDNGDTGIQECQFAHAVGQNLIFVSGRDEDAAVRPELLACAPKFGFAYDLDRIKRLAAFVFLLVNLAFQMCIRDSFRPFRTVCGFPSFRICGSQRLLFAQQGGALPFRVLQPFVGNPRHPFADAASPSCTTGFCPDGFSAPVFSFCPFFVLGMVCLDGGAVPSCGIEINGTVGGL